MALIWFGRLSLGSHAAAGGAGGGDAVPKDLVGGQCRTWNHVVLKRSEDGSERSLWTLKSPSAKQLRMWAGLLGSLFASRFGGFM